MTKLIVANWKMNGNLTKIDHDINCYLSNNLTNQNNVVLAIPYPFIITAINKLKQHNSPINIASQDISKFDDFGAYTGEISAPMLHEIGINYSIIGHSERRQNFNEKNNDLVQKITNAVNHQIIPILCIGESLEVRQSNSYVDFLLKQLECLKLVTAKIDKLVIAYEPIWSIGSGLIPQLSEIEEAMVLIHKFMQNNLPHVRISTLYGGSVSAKNAVDVLNTYLVNGVLVGGASLNVNDFTAICGSC